MEATINDETTESGHDAGTSRHGPVGALGWVAGAMGWAARESMATVADQVVYVVSPAAALERRVLRQINKAADARMQAARMSRGDEDRDRNDEDRLHGPQWWLGCRLSPYVPDRYRTIPGLLPQLVIR